MNLVAERSSSLALRSESRVLYSAVSEMTSVRAFLHEEPHEPDAGDTSSLPLPPLSFLTLSQVGVDASFHLPLDRFTDPRYLREH